MRHILATTLLLSSLYLVSTGYRILVVPSSVTKSHHYAYTRFICLLSEQGGHDVFVYNPLIQPGRNGPMKFPCNMTDRAIQFNGTNRHVEGSEFADLLYKVDQTMEDIATFFGEILEATKETGRNSVNHIDELESLAGNLSFDIAITHNFGYYPLALTRYFLNQPTIILETCNVLLEQTTSMFGIDSQPAVAPNFMLGKSDRKDFRERLLSFISYAMGPWLEFNFKIGGTIVEELLSFAVDPLDKDAQNIFPKVVQQVPMVMVYAETVVEYARPTTHNMMNIGVIGGKSGNEHLKLNSKEWENLVASIGSPGKPEGIVMVSFGTTAHTELMPHHMKKAMADALLHIAEMSNHLVIWKVDKLAAFQDVTRPSPNFKLVEFLPQTFLLKSGKVKVFVSHGGYNSFIESCNSVVPLIVIPLFIDQRGNAERGVRIGMAIHLSKDQLSANSLIDSLETVLNDKTYKHRAEKVANMLSDSIISNEEMLLRSVGRIIRLKDKMPRLATSVSRLNLIQYYCIDVVGFLLTVTVLFSIAFIRLVRKVFRK